MNKFKKENYRFWHSPVALFLILFLLFLFGYKMIDLFEKERETSKKKELILDEINTLKERQIMLSKDMLKLNTEEGKEEILREKYQVVKEGEKLVTIVDEENKEDSLIKDDNKHGFGNWIRRIFNK